MISISIPPPECTTECKQKSINWQSLWEWNESSKRVQSLIKIGNHHQAYITKILFIFELPCRSNFSRHILLNRDMWKHMCDADRTTLHYDDWEHELDKFVFVHIYIRIFTPSIVWRCSKVVKWDWLLILEGEKERYVFIQITHTIRTGNRSIAIRSWPSLL